MKPESFKNRHIGISESDKKQMLETLGFNTMDEFINCVIPENIRHNALTELPPAMSEREYAEHIHEIIEKNKLFTTYIGQGWYDTITPAPIVRNVLENPVWYTSYTPYQAEISQGRLEALINFQTAICELTAMPLANCSLLDDATAAAEAMTMMYNLRSKEQIKNGATTLFVDKKIFPQILAVIHTRGIPQGIQIEVDDYREFSFTDSVFGCIVQYPNADGSPENYKDFIEKAHKNGTKAAVVADILSLAILTPPGEWGADIVLGSTQRLGTPMYYGGPSATYLATRDEFKRNMPGRIIGYSKDRYGKTALRMALQTREQHIKREKATSNICTAQALLASMVSFYTIYHGEEGLKEIAWRIHRFTTYTASCLKAWKYSIENHFWFDTLRIKLPNTVTAEKLRAIALSKNVNLGYIGDEVSVSLDETTTLEDVNILLSIFAEAVSVTYQPVENIPEEQNIDKALVRESHFMQQSIFKKYRTETELMRYIKRLERKDISLAHSMISLGSCTMKLNAASEMMPVSQIKLTNIHPMAPAEQTEGYRIIIQELNRYLSMITGFAGCSLQPNSGAAGEYTGLRCIRSYLESIGQASRDVVLIPASAHGTNPASAHQAGFNVVVINCDANGNVDMDDLRLKAESYKDRLAACMITYPSTHGIFETEIVEICQIIHQNGGQLYMDGANMNAQVGLTCPGFIGADVCHLNLHKTFAMPHGGGGPGVGPICVAPHLVPFLPQHPLINGGTLDTVSAAPFGNIGMAVITYGYIRMMGADGLKEATEAAILNANYLASRLSDTYKVLYRGNSGFVGHELILDCHPIKEMCNVTETDIAKRLMDYGFHAPTLSFPVHETLMIEPTESESLHELDRFIETLHSIYQEIEKIASGESDSKDNVLVNSPHPEYEITADEWNHPYSRKSAAYPLDWIEENKFWINAARIDNAFGDRNLVATVQE